MKEKVFIKNRDGLKIAINVITSPINKKLVILEHGLSARKNIRTCWLWKKFLLNMDLML